MQGLLEEIARRSGACCPSGFPGADVNCPQTVLFDPMAPMACFDKGVASPFQEEMAGMTPGDHPFDDGPDAGATIRQRMVALLLEGERSAIELSQELRIPEKEVYLHLPHVAKSVESQGKKLVIQPPVCLRCGFDFKERKRFTRPGRCPRCKGTRLERPRYEIV